MATQHNFRVKNGLEVGGQEVINSSGVVASSALTNVASQFTVFGRSANTTISISNATFTVVGRDGNISVGVS
jgi:hypothetical protein